MICHPEEALYATDPRFAKQIVWHTPPGAGPQGRCAPGVVSDHAGECR
jgi:hypothetical protein